MKQLTKLVVYLAVILLVFGILILIAYREEKLTIVHVATFYVGFAVGVFMYLLSEFEDKVKEVKYESKNFGKGS